MELARLTAKTAESQFSLRCESAAWHVDRLGYGYGYTPGLLCFSAVGPDTAIKAVRAMLYEPKVTVGFLLEVPAEDEDDRKTVRMEKTKRDKYVTYEARTARLGARCVHLVAMAKVEGLLVDTSEAALYEQLASDRYNTPLLRSWVPWLRKRLIEEELLIEAEGHRCGAGLLLAEGAELDALVSEGVREGALEMIEPLTKGE